MVCLRSIILRASIFGRLDERRCYRYMIKSSNTNLRLSYTRGCRYLSARKMMVDVGSSDKQQPVVDVMPKEDDAGFATGGWKSEDGKLSIGYSSFRGKRANMEDFYDVKISKIDGHTVSLFGIFDGHGGSRAAEYLKKHLFENMMNHAQFFTDTKLAITETFQQTDMGFLESERDTFRDDGSTASTAVLVGNHLYVANVGDSRAIIFKAGKAIALSEDHKPNRNDERKRIENAGGIVIWAGTWRVGGVLAMSRAFGNRMLKQFVVAEPEIQDAASLAATEDDPESAARKLTETAFNRGSADNITCIVVKFHHKKPENLEGGDTKSKEESTNILHQQPPSET